MHIVFFGTPEFAVPSLDALIESDEKVVAVITQPDRTKGRGRTLSAPHVKEYALSKGIPVMQPEAIKSPSLAEELKTMNPELLVVVAYGKIIPASILHIPLRGCINVHASLLPKYRGAAPIQWALIHGEKRTGITTMLMDEGLDTGDLLLQADTEISDNDTAYSLGERLSRIGASLLIQTIKGLQQKTLHPRPQRGEPSYAPPLTKDDGRIDWSLPAEDIYNLIRGTYPWPGAYCFLNRERISIMRARPIQTHMHVLPGRIEKTSDDGLQIGTGDGILSVLEVKPEGKKAMPAAAFVNGRHLKEGLYFETA